MESIAVFLSLYYSLSTFHPKCLFTHSIFFTLLAHLVRSLQNIALYSKKLSLIAAMESLCLRRAVGERDAVSQRETVCSTNSIGHEKGVE
jgi:hypothetical protein